MFKVFEEGFEPKLRKTQRYKIFNLKSRFPF